MYLTDPIQNHHRHRQQHVPLVHQRKVAFGSIGTSVTSSYATFRLNVVLCLDSTLI